MYNEINPSNGSELFKGISVSATECQALVEWELSTREAVKEWIKLVEPSEIDLLKAMLVEIKHRKRRYILDSLRSRFNKLRAEREEKEIAEEWING
jgi:hypothetical protein